MYILCPVVMDSGFFGLRDKAHQMYFHVVAWKRMNQTREVVVVAVAAAAEEE